MKLGSKYSIQKQDWLGYETIGHKFISFEMLLHRKNKFIDFDNDLLLMSYFKYSQMSNPVEDLTKEPETEKILTLEALKKEYQNVRKNNGQIYFHRYFLFQ